MKPKPEEQDRALFREAIRGVKPLQNAPRVSGDAPRPRARARVRHPQPLPLLEEFPLASGSDVELAAGDASSFARPGISATTLRKLRRGQYRIQARLDLHGLTVAEAKGQLREFLSTALRRNARCLHIVHGKGLRSGPQGPVLRQLVNAALRGTAAVRAFASARPADGGTGALYVLLDAAHASSASTTAD